MVCIPTVVDLLTNLSTTAFGVVAVTLVMGYPAAANDNTIGVTKNILGINQFHDLIAKIFHFIQHSASDVVRR